MLSESQSLSHNKMTEAIEIPTNTKIKEFKCENENCIAYIKYIDGETEKVHCPLCKQEYSINHLELITKK